MKRKPVVVIAATVVTLAMFGQTSQSNLMAQVTVFDDQNDFVSATGATLVPIPLSETAFPGTSCGPPAIATGRGTQVQIPFGSNSLTLTQDLTAPGNSARGICIFDDGVVRDPANTNPNVMDGNTIVGNGEDDYLVVFDEPVHAVGFRLLTNFCADEVVTLSDSGGAQISSEDIDALTGTNTRQFVGFKSSTAIKSLVIDTCNGDTQNEGIDEIKVLNGCVANLIAGGGNETSGVEVGDVTVVDNSDGTWDVIYNTTDDWRILELHLALGCGEGNIPQTKKGNPIPGQFPYKWYPNPPDEWAQSVIFPDVVPPTACSCVVFAAHAVVVNLSVCDPREALVFGTERGVNNGDVFAIDLAGGTATSVFDTTPTPADQNQPNGNAFDAANNRLYYSAVTPEDVPSDLFFVDFDDAVLSETAAGTLGGFVAGASFFDGKYYYIENRTDDVRAVSFNPDGTAASDAVVISGFTGLADENFRFGDIVMNLDGVLFGSAQVLGGTTVLRNEFFKIDLNTSIYTQIQPLPTSAGTRQLAFGSDGTLYGHNAGTGEFFSIDPTNGNETSIGTVTGSSTGQFTDLASVPLCNPQIETAWGDGMDFSGRNWATYFECGECNGAASGVR